MNLKKFISGISALTIAASAFAGLAITAEAVIVHELDYIGSSNGPESFSNYNYATPANGSWGNSISNASTLGDESKAAIVNVDYNTTSNTNYSSLEELLAAYDGAESVADVENALDANQSLTENDGTYTVSTTITQSPEYFSGKALVVRKRSSGSQTATFTATNSVSSGKIVFKAALGARGGSFHGGSVTLNNAAGTPILTVTFPDGNKTITVVTGTGKYTTSNSSVRNDKGYGSYIDVVLDLDKLTVKGTYKSRRTTNNLAETQTINATLPSGTSFGGLSITNTNSANVNCDTMIDDVQLYHTKDEYEVANTTTSVTASVDKVSAYEGETVTITSVTPNSGYGTPEGLSVTNTSTGDAVPYDSEALTFTMPDSDVAIKAYAPWIGTGVKELNTDFDNTTMFTTGGTGSVSINASTGEIGFGRDNSSIANGYVAFTAHKTGKIAVSFIGSEGQDGRRYTCGIYSNSDGTGQLDYGYNVEKDTTTVLNADVTAGNTYYLTSYKSGNACGSKITSIVFTPPSYTITANSNDSAEVSNVAPAMEGAEVAITAEPKPGYGTPVTYSATYTDDNNVEQSLTVDQATGTFTMPAYPVTVTASFVRTSMRDITVKYVCNGEEIASEKVTNVMNEDNTAFEDVTTKNVNETVKVPFRQYVVKDGALYKTTANSSPYYLESVTPTTASYVVTKNVTPVDINDGTLAFFEDLDNSAAQNASIRASAGSAYDNKAYTSTTNLTPGVYKFIIRAQSKGRNSSVVVGNTTIWSASSVGSGSWGDRTKTVVIKEAAPISLKPGSSNTIDDYDTIIAIRLGDIPSGKFTTADWTADANSGYTASGNVLTQGSKSMYGYQATLTGYEDVSFSTIKATLKSEGKADGEITWSGMTVTGTTPVQFYLVTNAELDTVNSSIYCE